MLGSTGEPGEGLVTLVLSRVKLSSSSELVEGDPVTVEERLASSRQLHRDNCMRRTLLACTSSLGGGRALKTWPGSFERRRPSWMWLAASVEMAGPLQSSTDSIEKKSATIGDFSASSCSRTALQYDASRSGQAVRPSALASAAARLALCMRSPAAFASPISL